MLGQAHPLLNDYTHGSVLVPMQKFSLVTNDVDIVPLRVVIEKYLSYYAADSSSTARAKRGDLHTLYEFVRVRSKGAEPTLEELTLSLLRSFVESRLLSEEPSTVSRRVASIKHFCKRLVKLVPHYVDPTEELRGPIVRQAEPEYLNREQVAKLRIAALQVGESKFLRMRNKALVELLLGTGMRVAEICQLRYYQLDENSEWLRNVKCKGQRFRDVFIAPNVRRWLDEYLFARYVYLNKRDREFLEQPSAYPIFVSNHYAQTGAPETWALSVKAAYDVVRRAGALAGIKGLHPHLLRHTFAQELYDTTKDIELVREALGHTSLGPTMRYTRRVKQKIVNAVSQLFEEETVDETNNKKVN